MWGGHIGIDHSAAFRAGLKPVEIQTFGCTRPMLYIDPDECIDCGACVDRCPVDAIDAEEDFSNIARSCCCTCYARGRTLSDAGPPKQPWTVQ